MELKGKINRKKSMLKEWEYKTEREGQQEEVHAEGMRTWN